MNDKKVEGYRLIVEPSGKKRHGNNRSRSRSRDRDRRPKHSRRRRYKSIYSVYPHQVLHLLLQEVHKVLHLNHALRLQSTKIVIKEKQKNLNPKNRMRKNDLYRPSLYLNEEISDLFNFNFRISKDITFFKHRIFEQIEDLIFIHFIFFNNFIYLLMEAVYEYQPSSTTNQFYSTTNPMHRTKLWNDS
jgi:hypothetical protein